MADDKESPRAARMFEAVQGLERRLGRRVTLDELGAWTAEREGRSDSYAGSVVRRWLKGLSEPRGSAGWQALAEVLGVSAGWLAFGEPAVRQITAVQQARLDRAEAGKKARRERDEADARRRGDQAG